MPDRAPVPVGQRQAPAGRGLAGDEVHKRPGIVSGDRAEPSGVARLLRRAEPRSQRQGQVDRAGERRPTEPGPLTGAGGWRLSAPGVAAPRLAAPGNMALGLATLGPAGLGFAAPGPGGLGFPAPGPAGLGFAAPGPGGPGFPAPG